MANKHKELSATANVAMNMFRAVHIPEKNDIKTQCAEQILNKIAKAINKILT